MLPGTPLLSCAGDKAQLPATVSGANIAVVSKVARNLCYTA